MTFNRPRRLNAISVDVFPLMAAFLEKWEKDHEAQLIIIKGSGLAFSRGGDLKLFYESRKLSCSSRWNCHGWRCLLYGPNEVLCCHGKCRLCHSRNSYWLSPRLWFFLHAFSPPWPSRRTIIDECFSKDSMEEIVSSCETEASKEGNGWMVPLLKGLKRLSPTALKITLQSIREGRKQTLAECLKKELRIAANIMQSAISGDLYEGIRAVLIDNDKAPKKRSVLYLSHLKRSWSSRYQNQKILGGEENMKIQLMQEKCDQ